MVKIVPQWSDLLSIMAAAACAYVLIQQVATLHADDRLLQVEFTRINARIRNHLSELDQLLRRLDSQKSMSIAETRTMGWRVEKLDSEVRDFLKKLNSQMSKTDWWRHAALAGMIVFGWWTVLAFLSGEEEYHADCRCVCRWSLVAGLKKAANPARPLTLSSVPFFAYLEPASVREKEMYEQVLENVKDIETSKARLQQILLSGKDTETPDARLRKIIRLVRHSG